MLEYGNYTDGSGSILVTASKRIMPSKRGRLLQLPPPGTTTDKGATPALAEADNNSWGYRELHAQPGTPRMQPARSNRGPMHETLDAATEGRTQIDILIVNRTVDVFLSNLPPTRFVLSCNACVLVSSAISCMSVYYEFNQRINKRTL